MPGLISYTGRYMYMYIVDVYTVYVLPGLP